MRDAATAYIGLGANIGDRLRVLRSALAALSLRGGVDVDFASGVASLYETSPVGGPEGQSSYLNSVVRVTTRLAPIELLRRLLSIENSLGRTRGVRWGERRIDLDLLLYDEIVHDSPELTLPHPRLHERRFVLKPLSEIAADFLHPTQRKSVAQLANDLPNESSGETVVKVAGPEWRFEPVPAGVR